MHHMMPAWHDVERDDQQSVLRRVTIPSAVLPPELRICGGTEAAYDVRISGTQIAAIEPPQKQGPSGGLLIPGLIDAHVHLDKTATHDPGLKPAAGLMEAINRSMADRALWTISDIEQRAEWGLKRAWSHGTVAMRTFVDWPDQVPAAWEVLGALAHRWQDRLIVQRANLTALTTLADPARGPAIAERVAKDGGILGTFILPAATELSHPLDVLMQLAHDLDLELDFHVDEGLDPASRGVDAVISAVERHGFKGRVTLGHACALGTRSQDEVASLLKRAASLDIRMVSLPLTNLFLQDRLLLGTPRQRGLSPMREAMQAGVSLSIASDNVGDPFHPYGDYDPLEALHTAIRAGHLDDDLAGQWARVTVDPARLMGAAGDGMLRIGGPADFVRLGAASSHQWMARPHCGRQVWRKGKPIEPLEAPWPRQDLKETEVAS